MKYIIISIGFLLLLTNLTGQTTTRPYRKYKTQKIARKLIKDNPELIEAQKKMERKIWKYTMNNDNPDVTIPIIFHSIYKKNKHKVSPELIYSQLEALNNAFQLDTSWLHPAHYIEGLDQILPANLGIQFCLADVDLMNNGQYGINYVPTDTVKWGNSQAIKSENTGGIAPHKPKKYLNIWIGNLGVNKAGYAQFPWGPAETDGIVIDYRVFGQRDTSFAPYHLGKTLVHLVGNYLGLNDLWNDRRTCVDDGIEDTPIHNAANYGKQDFYKHVSTCDGYPMEHTMNFMDATDDAYVYMFTQKQMQRMHAVLGLGSLRKQLTNSSSRCSVIPNLIENNGATRNSSSPVNSRTQVLETPKLSVAPNPAKSSINLMLSGKARKVIVEIYNSSGVRLHLNKLGQLDGEHQYFIDCSRWIEGIYFVKARMDESNLTHRFAVVR